MLVIWRCGAYQIGLPQSSLGAGSQAPARKLVQMEWRTENDLIEYEAALALMQARAAAIRAGTGEELVWLLEHPPLYSAGTSARATDLLAPGRLPVYRSGRGGKHTYHGPGQRVGYVIMDLRSRGQTDVRAYVRNLEDWIIRTLARFHVRGERREGRIGIWVDRGNGCEDKIAAIGVRIRQWVTLHGVAINLDPALENFSGIVPCGISGENYGVTSLHRLGIEIAMPELDVALKAAFSEVFGDPGDAGHVLGLVRPK
jgi:lipoyl(octanoyl) transferase